MRYMAALTVLLSACAGTYESGETSPPAPSATEASGKCDAAPVQKYVGEKLSDALAETIRQESGSAKLRTGGPDSMWTMDYREDRVNIRHNADMVIEAITCG